MRTPRIEWWERRYTIWFYRRHCAASGTLSRQAGDATEIAAPLGSGPAPAGGDAQ